MPFDKSSQTRSHNEQQNQWTRTAPTLCRRLVERELRTNSHINTRYRTLDTQFAQRPIDNWPPLSNVASDYVQRNLSPTKTATSFYRPHSKKTFIYSTFFYCHPFLSLWLRRLSCYRVDSLSHSGTMCFWTDFKSPPCFVFISLLFLFALFEANALRAYQSVCVSA